MMLSFDYPSGHFQYRTASVILHDNHVLLNTTPADAYWFLPGGRVEAQETAAEAIVREIDEELGMVATVLRPLWLLENLYQQHGKDYHELGMYFLLTVHDAEQLPFGQDIEGIEPDEDLIYRWFAVNNLPRIDLKPECLQTLLRDIPDEFMYYVQTG